MSLAINFANNFAEKKMKKETNQKPKETFARRR